MTNNKQTIEQINKQIFDLAEQLCMLHNDNVMSDTRDELEEMINNQPADIAAVYNALFNVEI